MIRMLLIAFVAVITAAPAWAQNTEAFCQFLPVKENFVGADYVPGVDVNGNPVVPADVKSRAKEFVDVIRIPLTIDLAKQLGQTVPEGTEMKAPLGMIEINKNSTVTLNGEVITDQAYKLCGKTPFNIDAATVEPEKKAPSPKVPDKKPDHEEIIWGQGY